MVIIFYLTVFLIRIALCYAILSFVLSFIVSRELRKNKWLKWILSRKWSLILFVVILVLIRFLGHFFWINTDSHPVFTNVDIAGNWQDRNAQLHFEPNGVVLYRRATDNKYQQCRWETKDTFIIIKDENGQFINKYQVIRFFKELRITDKIYEDPDESLSSIGVPKIKGE